MTKTQNPKAGSLVVVGTGIMLAGQITVEARSHIVHAQRVHAKVADPVTMRWLSGLNPALSFLDDLYQPGRSRLKTYADMAERIMNDVRSGFDVCAVFYGHPGVFVDPSHMAIRKAREEGFPAKMLPGVSAEDCLFADLGLDPGRTGCQCFEATQFLFYQHRNDPYSALILWQIDVVGDHTLTRQGTSHAHLQALVTRLLEDYPASHEVVVYEAAVLPIQHARAERVALSDLPAVRLQQHSTLLVPPLPDTPLDHAMIRRLGLAPNEI